MREDVLVVRHPVFDDDSRLCGYEVKLRPASLLDAVDLGEREQAGIVAELLTGLDLTALLRDMPVLLRVPPAFLVAAAPVLPPDRLVLVLGSDDELSDAAVTACADAAADGYRLVLEAAGPIAADHPLLTLAAAVKVDMSVLADSEARAIAGLARRCGLALYASGVMDVARLQAALSLGCALLEGTFFQRPELIGGRALSPGQLCRLQLVSAVSKPSVDFAEVEALIKREGSLALTFLAYVNSAAFGWRQRITSLRHALTLVGEQGIRRWASVLALSGPSEPNSTAAALLESAVARARFCEALATRLGEEVAPFEAFLAGLLSLMDAVFEQPLDEILHQVALPGAVRQALHGGTGPLAPLLRLVIAYEKGAWKAVQRHSDHLGLRLMDVAGDYLLAVEFTGALHGDEEPASA